MELFRYRKFSALMGVPNAERREEGEKILPWAVAKVVVFNQHRAGMGCIVAAHIRSLPLSVPFRVVLVAVVLDLITTCLRSPASPSVGLSKCENDRACQQVLHQYFRRLGQRPSWRARRPVVDGTRLHNWRHTAAEAKSHSTCSDTCRSTR